MQNIVRFFNQLTAWRFPMHLMGSAPFIWCAFRACEREADGERWAVMALCDEYARAHEGWTQWAVWRNIQDALKASQGPKRPGDAIRALVRVVK